MRSFSPDSLSTPITMFDTLSPPPRHTLKKPCSYSTLRSQTSQDQLHVHTTSTGSNLPIEYSRSNSRNQLIPQDIIYEEGVLVTPILPRTPTTPSVLITPPRTKDDHKSTYMTQSSSSYPSSSLAIETKPTYPPASPFDEPNTILGDSCSPQSGFPIKQVQRKQSFGDRLARLGPLIMVGVPSLKNIGRSPTTPNSMTVSPATSTGLNSPLSGGGGMFFTGATDDLSPATKGLPVEEEIYTLKLARGSPISDDSLPDLILCGPDGTIYIAKHNISKNRIELFRQGNRDHQEFGIGQKDVILATMSIGKSNFDREVISVRSGRLKGFPSIISSSSSSSTPSPLLEPPTLSGFIPLTPSTPFTPLSAFHTFPSLQDGNPSQTVTSRPVSGDKIKTTRVMMGGKPGCFGSRTIVTRDHTLEWAQTTTLSKCVDLATKETIAKLQYRLFKEDRLILCGGESHEVNGSVLMMSACKIWWDGNAKKDFRVVG